MQKIPLLFKTNEQRKYVIPEINPAAAWVFNEPAIAHRKYDGTCMLLEDGAWWARRQTKTPAKIQYFRQVDSDPLTGKRFGWEPAVDSPFIKFLDEAVLAKPLDCDIFDDRNGEYEDGTYELLGPKINNNPEKLKKHRLMPHNRAQQLGDIQMLELDLAEDPEQAYAELKRVLFYLPVEGVVFKDREMRRMAKLRRKDFDFSDEELNARIQESQQRQRAALSKMLDGSNNDWESGTI